MKNLKHLLCILMVGMSLSTFAQATDLVIDNQTPGWLSSKINYADQSTVRNLTVTGYINATDLKFMALLIQNYSLDGCLDLSDANIVYSSASEPANRLCNFKFDLSPSLVNVTKTIRKISLPKTLESHDAFEPKLRIDTLVINDNHFIVSTSDDYRIKNIYFSEYVDSVPSKACYQTQESRIANLPENVSYIGESAFRKVSFTSDSLVLPKSVKYIGASAFRDCPAIKYIDYSDLDSLVFLGDYAFNGTSYVADSYVVPENLEKFYVSSFNAGDNTFFFSKNIQEINADNFQSHNNIFHLENSENPPVIDSKYNEHMAGYSSWGSYFTIYVPKSSIQAYENDDRWKNCRIIGVSKVESINLNYSELILDKDQTKQLSVLFTPSDADDTSVTWEVEDSTIVSVDENGKVTALSPGTTSVIVTSVPKGVSASCTVTVMQHVTGITMDVPEIEFTKIGENAQLTATVLPEDASNKTLNWSSSNNAVCVVANGKVVAAGNGTAVIVATSEDGGFMDYCTVTVKDISGIEGVISDKSVSGSVYDVTGRRIESPRKGQLYVKGGKKVIVEE